MKAVDEKIGKFIGNSDTVFVIPPFQRNYSWDEEQCSELFEDIMDSIKRVKVTMLGTLSITLVKMTVLDSMNIFWWMVSRELQQYCCFYVPYEQNCQT